MKYPYILLHKKAEKMVKTYLFSIPVSFWESISYKGNKEKVLNWTPKGR